MFKTISSLSLLVPGLKYNVFKYNRLEPGLRYECAYIIFFCSNLIIICKVVSPEINIVGQNMVCIDRVLVPIVESLVNVEHCIYVYAA